MTETITAKRAVELLEAVVAEKGADYEYPGTTEGCVYFYNSEGDYRHRALEEAGLNDGDPACIVGCALARLGVTIETLGNDNDWLDAGNLGWLREHATDEAREVFQQAQLVQDGGAPWGHALSAAKDALAVAA